MADVVLNEVEARLLGVLIEKQLTTPDQYPLTYNALRVGSNQKSNRHPVVEYSEAEVVVGVTGLLAKGLVTRLAPGLGARVERFEHQAKAVLLLDRAQLAVLAELLLRGPQQPGELRTRASRMHQFPTLLELEHVLEALHTKHLVKSLAPSPGTRAERYRELLSSPLAAAGSAPEPRASATAPRPPSTPEAALARHDALAAERRTPAAPSASAATSAPAEERLAALEARLARVEAELAELRRRSAAH
jgi:uncharacterized protein YceH (UPF0502 family)